MATRVEIERVTTAIVDSAYRMHRQMGPGLLESAYQACLSYELSKRGHSVQSEVLLPIEYDRLFLDVGCRADMIVDGLVIVEHKTVQSLAPIHYAQLMTYLKVSNLWLGFLINWNIVLIKQGIKRVVQGSPEET